MKLVVMAGTPGSGKTSVLIHTVRALQAKGLKPAAVKIDCLSTDDDQRLGKLHIPVVVGLAKDMCPDHFAIYNTEEMVEWARGTEADVLINETAGLCLRCAPYPDSGLAVCVIDVTSGPNTPLKVGPLLTAADVVVMTKGDMVSQAEREVFRERVLEVNPECQALESNGLTGKGAMELADIITGWKEAAPGMELRHNPPFAICTLCAGERRVDKKHHRGVLRHLDGQMKYVGE